MPLPTTRYERYKYRQRRYAARYRKWRVKRRKCAKNLAGKTINDGYHPIVELGPKQLPHGVKIAGVPTPIAAEVPFLGHPFVFTPAAYASPPHVRNNNVQEQLFRDAGQHLYYPVIGYHCRRRVALPTHVKPYKRSKLDRQITGCNWFFFRNGCFSDTDVLGRHPNETDIANGAPLPNTLWPVPLGY